MKSGGFCFDQQLPPGIEHAAPTALECPEILIQPCIFNLSHPAVIRKEGKPLEECWRLVSRDGTTGKWLCVDSTNLYGRVTLSSSEISNKHIFTKNNYDI